MHTAGVKWVHWFAVTVALASVVVPMFAVGTRTRSSSSPTRRGWWRSIDPGFRAGDMHTNVLATIVLPCRLLLVYLVSRYVFAVTECTGRIAMARVRTAIGSVHSSSSSAPASATESAPASASAYMASEVLHARRCTAVGAQEMVPCVILALTVVTIAQVAYLRSTRIKRRSPPSMR